MKDIHLEFIIALMNKRAKDAGRSPREALRHLINAGILTTDGTLAPEYEPDEDASTAITSTPVVGQHCL